MVYHSNGLRPVLFLIDRLEKKHNRHDKCFSSFFNFCYWLCQSLFKVRSHTNTNTDVRHSTNSIGTFYIFWIPETLIRPTGLTPTPIARGRRADDVSNPPPEKSSKYIASIQHIHIAHKQATLTNEIHPAKHFFGLCAPP